ncbi:hypothetical protein BZA70DRAFT_237135 [Myxozyma melibiosi]|uniref:Phosphotransferase n=1 Tax=Myxozyma melibiosi TaxID=54550 RepID=A0ABR1F8C4_9ASCO
MTMLPAYVHAMPRGCERGTFVALDVGGSNLRIAVVRFTTNSNESSTREILYQTGHALDEAIRNLDGRSFFLWIASQLEGVVAVSRGSGWIDPGVVDIGLTWSFPLESHSVNTGKILSMGKGFTAISQDIIGLDLKTLFEDSCAAVGLEVRLRAVVNDAVAVLLSHLNVDPRRTKIGLIVGTGVNASVLVPSTVLDEERLMRCDPREIERCSDCVINTELSLFGAGVLPRTRWDDEVDAENEIPGFQPLEMMCSGRYMPEIARRIVRDRVLRKRNGQEEAATGLGRIYGLDAETMSVVEGALDVAFARQQLLARVGGTVSIAEVRAMRSVFYAVSCRAAAVIAAALVAVTLAVLPPETPGGETGGAGSEVVVAVTGSVIEKYAGFRARVQEFANLLGRRWNKRLVIAVERDGPLLGGAVGAACNE